MSLSSILCKLSWGKMLTQIMTQSDQGRKRRAEGAFHVECEEMDPFFLDEILNIAKK